MAGAEPEPGHGDRTSRSARTVSIPLGPDLLAGDLRGPARSSGLVIFAHGSGSGRTSPRNVFVARALERAGIGSLLLDLLTGTEAEDDARTGRFRFDIPRLANRLVGALDWASSRRSGLGALPFGLYGASTGGAAALIAAARRPNRVRALVLRGARSDLADTDASLVEAPTLFVVGSRDPAIVAVNRATLRRMRAETRLEIVPGASHLFEEDGALEAVARWTVDWFRVRLEAPALPVAARD